MSERPIFENNFQSGAICYQTPGDIHIAHNHYGPSYFTEQKGKTEVSERKMQLAVFIKDDDWLEKTVIGLERCTTPRNYAMDVIYPLYEEGLLKDEQIVSKNFIEATIPFCNNLRTPSYTNLYQAVNRLFRR